MRRAPSLRRRLLLAGLSGIVLVTLVATWVLGEAFRRASEGAFERTLNNEFAALVGRLESLPDGSTGLRKSADDPRFARVFSGSYWQVGEGPDALVSRSLWDFDVALPAAPSSGARELLSAGGPVGQSLRVVRQRVYLARATLSVTVWVAADDSAVLQEVADFRRLSLAAVGLLSALCAAVLAVQIRVGLRPFARLSVDLARVRSGGLARLETEDLPSEITPLAGHLNELLDHHEQSMIRARRSAADLAHALKTPLAALDAAAQRLDGDLAAAVREQCGRMHAVVRRRLEAGVAIDFRARTPIAPVAKAIAAMLASVHQSRDLAIDLRIADGSTFPGATEDLEEILGNLMDNACKWAASRVVVGASHGDGTLQLWVEDDGPGIAPEAVDAALSPGVRLDERVPGSGLGLTIVSEVLASYRGSLSLERSPLGGLLARAEVQL